MKNYQNPGDVSLISESSILPIFSTYSKPQLNNLHDNKILKNSKHKPKLTFQSKFPSIILKTTHSTASKTPTPTGMRITFPNNPLLEVITQNSSQLELCKKSSTVIEPVNSPVIGLITTEKANNNDNNEDFVCLCNEDSGTTGTGYRNKSCDNALDEGNNRVLQQKEEKRIGKKEVKQHKSLPKKSTQAKNIPMTSNEFHTYMQKFTSNIESHALHINKSISVEPNEYPLDLQLERDLRFAVKNKLEKINFPKTTIAEKTPNLKIFTRQDSNQSPPNNQSKITLHNIDNIQDQKQSSSGLISILDNDSRSKPISTSETNSKAEEKIPNAMTPSMKLNLVSIQSLNNPQTEHKLSFIKSKNHPKNHEILFPAIRMITIPELDLGKTMMMMGNTRSNTKQQSVNSPKSFNIGSTSPVNHRLHTLIKKKKIFNDRRSLSKRTREISNNSNQNPLDKLLGETLETSLRLSYMPRQINLLNIQAPTRSLNTSAILYPEASDEYSHHVGDIPSMPLIKLDKRMIPSNHQQPQKDLIPSTLSKEILHEDKKPKDQKLPSPTILKIKHYDSPSKFEPYPKPKGIINPIMLLKDQDFLMIDKALKTGSIKPINTHKKIRISKKSSLPNSPINNNNSNNNNKNNIEKRIINSPEIEDLEGWGLPSNNSYHSVFEV